MPIFLAEFDSSKKTSGRGGCSAISPPRGSCASAQCPPMRWCRTRPHGYQAGGCEVSIDLLVVTNHLLQVGCFHCGHFLYRHYWALPLENSLLVWIPATLNGGMSLQPRGKTNGAQQEDEESGRPQSEPQGSSLSNALEWHKINSQKWFLI